MHRQMSYEKIMYEFSNDPEKIKQTMSDIMREESPVQIILFKEAMNHVIRIIRILRLSCGHMVLIGEGGCGKKSMCQIAAIITGFNFYMI